MAKKRGAAARRPGPAPRPCGLLAFRGESGRSLQRFTSSWHEKSRLCAHTWRAELARPLAPPPAPPCRAGRKTLTKKMKRIDPPERALSQARAARGYAQGARSLNVVVFFFILPLLILTHNSRWGRGEGVRSGRTWPRALSRPLSGRSQSGGHSAAAQSGRTTICRSFSFPTGAREGGLVPGRARRQARCPASAPPSATLWPPNAAHEALRPGPP